MRTLLGTLAALLGLLAALAGCGDSEVPDEAAATSAPAEPILVSGTAAGGETAKRFTRLPDDAALAGYAEQFRGSLPGDLTEAAGSVDVADGEVLAAQVVSIGCDVPDRATVQGDAIVPAKIDALMKECLAAVTTVALAAVSSGQNN